MIANAHSSSLGQAIASAAASAPRRLVRFWLRDGGEMALSLKELNRRTQAVASGLGRRGVNAGDVLAVQLPNGPEAAVAVQAGFLLGATVLPIVQTMGIAETTFILRQSKAKVLILPTRWGAIDYRERFSGLGGLPDLTAVVMVGPDRPRAAVSWETLLAEAVFPQSPSVDPGGPAVLIYTSGTTAEPKGVQHNHRSLLAEMTSRHEVAETASPVRLSPWPSGHVAGFLGLLRLYLDRGQTILMEKWDMAAASELIERHKVTNLSGAPVMLAELLDRADLRPDAFASIREFATGAASVPVPLLERAERAGVTTYRVYGSSEHPTISSGMRGDDFVKRTTTDGRLMPGVEVRILDEQDTELGLGCQGEIVSRGPDLFMGYRDPALDRDAFLPGGWFRTGDVGSLDADGFLTITDRKKDIIIRGGENISSKEVEDILARHPAVAEVAVVATPHPRLGEGVCAFVVLRPSAEITLDDIGSHFAAAAVARQKTPERLEIVAELPRTPAGKVKKFELRGRFRPR